MNAIAPSRRAFLKASVTAAGGALFAFSVPAPLRAHIATGPVPTAHLPQVGAFLRIDPDNSITFLNPFIEMGQATYTAIPQIVAEELDAAMSQFRVEQAPHGPAYQIMDFGAPMRFTGGSLSIRSSYETFRKVGATARAMLVAAAAAELGVPAAELTVAEGVIRHEPSGRSLPFGAVAAAAAKLEPPADVPLKDPAAFRLIGTSVKRTDSVAKVTGTAWFGVDTRVEGMRHATVLHAPTLGGEVVSIDDSGLAGLPGAPRAVNLGGAVAVVADSFWRAKKAAEALKVEWTAPNAAVSTEALIEAATARLDETGIEAEAIGDAKAALAAATASHEATYVQPFLAHATMEPQNCAAWVQADRCDVWAPNQGADFVAMAAAAITGLPPEAIHVHTPYLGGGFGRRFVLDYAQQAIRVSKEIGAPVKLIWTREEDLRNDDYRPMAAVKLRAALAADGKPEAIFVTTVTDGPASRLMPSLVAESGLDSTAVEGLVAQPYRIPNKRTEFVPAGYAMVRVGFWRSVGGALNAFPYEAFLDELAEKAGADPLDYRLSLLEDGSNEKRLLEKVRDMAGYRTEPYEVDGSRRAMGVALHESFGSLVAEIAEVSLEGGRPRVHRVWVAIDLGQAVNPDLVKAQMMSGVIYGLSAALHEEVTIEGGAVTKANFDAYTILTPDEAPTVVAEVVTSDRPMGGVGEPGTPPVAAAVCGALFKLTGERVRRLPLDRHAFRDA